MPWANSDDKTRAAAVPCGLVVGPWLIVPDLADSERVYIAHEDGEGGTFAVADLEASLREFWRKHF